jgi:hypothetical protein
MRRTSLFIVAAATAVLVSASAGAVALAGSGNSSDPAANPQLSTCLHTEKVCNQAAWNKLTALPVAQPPAPHARLASSASVIAEARSLTRATATAPAATALMTGAQFLQRYGISRNSYINETRPVWIVTVKTPMRTDGGPARAGKLFDQVSFVIDAQTKTITDECIGCAWLPAS